MTKEHGNSVTPNEVWTLGENNQATKVLNPSILPEFVLETLEEGCLAMHDGKLYGLSPKHLLGE